MPPYRTRETAAQSLEVTVVDALEATAAPMFNILSPTPRALVFPFDHSTHTPLPSTANSPFEPDLRTLTLTPPALVPTPSSSPIQTSTESSASESSSSALTPARGSHRRRRSTASDINERRPKKGDEDYVKRPENAFILFRRKCVEDRNTALGAAAAEAGETGSALPKRQRQADLSKAISAQWKALTAEEKQYWEDLAKERKKAHAEQYPNYVYRPVRVKKKGSTTSKGKGKGRAEDEAGTDGELAFTMPVVVTPVRNGRRAVSAPTPPPMYQQIIVPSLPSVTLTPLSQSSDAPESPVEVASIAGRRISDVSDLESSWQFPYIEPFSKPEGWHPNSRLSDTGFDAFASVTYPTDECTLPPQPPLTIQTDTMCLSPMAFESAATSSGTSSPHLGPYTPATLESVTVPAAPDMWQSVPIGLIEPNSRLIGPQYEYAYPSFSFEPGVWHQGCAPLFNEDFDVDLIPSVTLGVPKFDNCAGADQCPPPIAIDIPLYDGSCQTAKMGPLDECQRQQRDPFMQTFHFDAALDLAARGEY